MEIHKSRCQQHHIPRDAVLVIGAGHFGSRAVRILTREVQSSVWIVDFSEQSLSLLDELPIRKVLCDGVRFLVDHFTTLNPMTTIVPAIPLHLAFEWLKGYLDGRFEITELGIPKGVDLLPPNVWEGSEGSLLVSYADFLCPDDCPEPEVCTVTGERRERPMYKLLAEISFTGHEVHIIRSHQLAPGLGGYRASDLTGAMERITSKPVKRWVLGTACKCHGILTAFELHPILKESAEKDPSLGKELA